LTVTSQKPKLNILPNKYERKTEAESDSSRSGFSPDAAVAEFFSLSHSISGDTVGGHAFAKKVSLLMSFLNLMDLCVNCLVFLKLLQCGVCVLTLF